MAGTDPLTTSSAGRQRAPTIKIDTSAVGGNSSPPAGMVADGLHPQTSGNPKEGNVSPPPTANHSPSPSTGQSSHASIPLLGESQSFESREDRPTNPLTTSSARRQRAPTIKIDTSAVGCNTSPPLEMVADGLHPRTSSNPKEEDASPPPTAHSPPSPSTGLSTRPSQSSHASIPLLGETQSFESREDKPNSPHNISSPTGRGDTSFLAVPVQRSRHNSVDSNDGFSFGGETAHGTSSGGSPTRERDNLLGSGGSPTRDGDESIRRTTGHEEAIELLMNDPEALQPDPGTEDDFEVHDNSFAFSPGQLNKLINPKRLSALWALGGLTGLEKGLRTDLKAGLSMDELALDGMVSFEDATGKAVDDTNTDGDILTPSLPKALQNQSTAEARPSTEAETGFRDRKRVFSDNRLPEKRGKSLLELMWITYNDKVLMLLTGAAFISLAIGLYQTFGTAHAAGEPRIEWVEGVAIIVAILIVVIVGSLNDFQKERQFVKLNKQKTDRNVKVIRSGKIQEISVFDVLVGDVVLLEAGDKLPVDGVLIAGQNVKCDESQATGESDLMRKKPADEIWRAIEAHEDVHEMDPFMLSGAQVTEGVGSFLVTSTGVNSSYGKTLMSLREDNEVTPLQSKLLVLAELIAKLGSAAGAILFIALFIKFIVSISIGNLHDEPPATKGQAFLSIFIVVVTIIVVAVPEGLPLAVTLALAFATTRMLKDNNLVRHLQACEVMGNATTICSDKTGTLTQNRMTVVAGTFGTSSSFGGTTTPNEANTPDVVDLTPKQVVSSLGDGVSTLLKESIALNSTAFDAEQDGVQTYIGSKTETALLEFARDFLGMGPVSEERSNSTVIQFYPFDSRRKCMGVVVKLDKTCHRLYVKGASEILLAKCTKMIRDLTKDVSSIYLTDEDRETLNSLITAYATRSLRTIALTYRDFDHWPPHGARYTDSERSQVKFADICNNMTFFGVVGIQDPLREGVRDAVETCQKAGVVVRMVTGDNMITAKAIAKDCGILTDGGIVMEGPTFRKLGKAEMDEKIPLLQVLARSSPEDKRMLVQRLKELGETVAVTGDGTNDAPALKAADVGFAMGIAGTEVAKEACDIVLMTDSVVSIVDAMRWGRAVNDAVKKFLGFQLTVNITAVILTFISAVSNDAQESVLSAVQLLWVNLIMDTLAALALATDPPTPSILDRKPDPKSAPLITVTMWKMIIGQALYQLTVTLILYFAGATILGDEDHIPTIVFNTFVWMQIFNQWNNRRLDNRFNIFEGVLKNWYFMGLQLVMMGAQIMIIFVGGAAFSVKPLDGTQWAICLVLGVVSIPLGLLLRCIPDRFLLPLIPRKRAKAVVPDLEGQPQFPPAFYDLKQQLTYLRLLKGGRVDNLKYAVQHPRSTIRPHSVRSLSHPASPNTPPSPNTQRVSSRVNSFGSATNSLTRSVSRSLSRGRDRRPRANSAVGATTMMAGMMLMSMGMPGMSPVESPVDRRAQCSTVDSVDEPHDE